ncbi:MAG: endopeptidase La [Legionellales bacterium]|nr:endopeptidase La [Legionellales bacterium]
MKEKDNNTLEIIDDKIVKLFPVLPLRDVVVYPNMIVPLFVGRDRSINAIEKAMLDDKKILLIAQKNAGDDEPDDDALYRIGTLSRVLQILKLPDGTVKLLVEGKERAKVREFVHTDLYMSASIKHIKDELDKNSEIDIMVRSLISQFEQYVKLNNKIPSEIINSLTAIEDPSRLADTIAAHLTLKIDEKQELLQVFSVNLRLEKLMVFLEAEIDLMQIEKKIRGRVKRQMETSQREYYLNEQMKAIQKELGEISNEPNDIDELESKIEKSGMPKDVKEKVMSEFNKLKLMSPMSAEASVMRNYIDWMVKIPWKKRNKIHIDLKQAQDVLDAEHYGLEKIKERIIEYLAVQQRVKKMKGQILCLVGPPGVGKTSLGSSIAEATGRSFVRIALGGVRDEAEIRGHRRTYVGSMPGNIIQKLAKIGVKNPLLMLDEVDKMAMDFRGDPAAALLEVLDPEQNNTFNDHYLEVDYDLSEVMFIATANSLEIPPALVDRMEIIRIPGYTEDEKIHIANSHLIHKQLKEHGLKESEFKISETAIKEIIRHYTREAGVRNLERSIAKLCRKVVKKIISEKIKGKAIHITQRNVNQYLGVQQYTYGLTEGLDRVGQVNGLAWTEVGGELLTIEAVAMPGKGKAAYTGQLGDVMQESIQAAMSVVRTRSDSLGIKEDFYEDLDIHVHVPEGATPKDGPSAGIGMCIALISSLTNIPVRGDVAMTGEITLRGEILGIGGLKEKLIAALRAGIKKVIISVENEKDLAEIPENIKEGLEIIPIKWIDESISIALTELPTPLKSKKHSSLLGVSKQSKKTKTKSRKIAH